MTSTPGGTTTPTMVTATTKWWVLGPRGVLKAVKGWKCPVPCLGITVRMLPVVIGGFWGQGNGVRTYRSILPCVGWVRRG